MNPKPNPTDFTFNGVLQQPHYDYAVRAWEKMEGMEGVFSHDKLVSLFKNIREARAPAMGSLYVMTDEHGNDIAEFYYLGRNEWRILIDNFPGQKKGYSTKFPFTADQFKDDMKRIGLNLQYK